MVNLRRLSSCAEMDESMTGWKRRSMSSALMRPMAWSRVMMGLAALLAALDGSGAAVEREMFSFADDLPVD